MFIGVFIDYQFLFLSYHFGRWVNEKIQTNKKETKIYPSNFSLINILYVGESRDCWYDIVYMIVNMDEMNKKWVKSWKKAVHCWRIFVHAHGWRYKIDANSINSYIYSFVGLGLNLTRASQIFLFDDYVESCKYFLSKNFHFQNNLN